MESILTSIKKLLGIDAEYNHFDPDIMTHINNVFMTLDQLGVEPKDPYLVTSDIQTWKQIFGDDVLLNEALKSYVHAKVKLAFDPPQQTALIEALERQTKESEWRINVRIEMK